jgi:glycerol uptake facilitator-like aquaporin
MLTGKISPFRCGLYTLAQCLGAIAGTGFVRIMTPAMFDKVDGGANEIAKNATAQEALGVEFGCTAMLVLTVMAAVDAHRADAQKHIPTIAPMVIGLAVTAAHFVAIPVDNCSINPARSFGVSAISGNWNDHIVFWVGPYLGSTAAAAIYYYLFAVSEEEKQKAATPAPAIVAAPVHPAIGSVSFVGRVGPGEAGEATVDMAPIDTGALQEWR